MSEPASACVAIALRDRALGCAVVGRAGGAVQALAIGAGRARRAARVHTIAHYITGGIRAVDVDRGASAEAGRRHRCANGAVRRTSALGRQAPSQERLGSYVGPTGDRRVQPGSQKRRNDLRPYLHCAEKDETKNHRELKVSFQRNLPFHFRTRMGQSPPPAGGLQSTIRQLYRWPSQVMEPACWVHETLPVHEIGITLLPQ